MYERKKNFVMFCHVIAMFLAFWSLYIAQKMVCLGKEWGGGGGVAFDQLVHQLAYFTSENILWRARTKAGKFYRVLVWLQRGIAELGHHL